MKAKLLTIVATLCWASAALAAPVNVNNIDPAPEQNFMIPLTIIILFVLCLAFLSVGIPRRGHNDT